MEGLKQKHSQMKKYETDLARLRNKCAGVFYITIDISIIILATKCTLIIPGWQWPRMISLLP
jgi:hypothetical protein